MTNHYRHYQNRPSIYSVKDYVTNRLSGINGITGTGVNTMTQSIIVYVNMDNPYVIDHIYQELGTARPYGYRLQFVTTGTIKYLL